MADGARVCWAVTCQRCWATFCGWDVDPWHLDVEAAIACAYCGGVRRQHPEQWTA
jgi:DNA-directed RNA polymerase subunit RPC12/RpoP